MNINFSFTRPQVKKADSIEHKNGGLRIYRPYTIGVSADYFPNADTFNLGQPQLYVRDTAMLNTKVGYYFSVPDSVVRLVEYAWDISKERNEIENLYNHNKEVISRILKQPGKETIHKQDNWSERTTIWENDSVHVKQFMFMLEGEPSRTRTLISWK